jgi:hypothetical protein
METKAMTINHAAEGSRTTVTVHPPSDETRRIVGDVTERAIAEPRHEHVIFETPGVLEALDDALEEIAALKRSM